MEPKQDYSRPLLFALALAVVFMGILRVFTLPANLALDQTTLLYFLCAGALILLDRVKSIAIGENKLEFQELRNEIAEAKSEARDAKVQGHCSVTRAGRRSWIRSSLPTAFTLSGYSRWKRST